MDYDVIGDIHGQAGKLETLLRQMGYRPVNGVWTPPVGRMAVFVGDLIDRGPNQIEVLEIARRMVDAGHARVALGNHELNAIGYATPRPDVPGEFLRAHSAKNLRQHAEFLVQVSEGSALHRELIHWFRSLPPYLDLGRLRVVHAWWHQPFVEEIARSGKAAPLQDDEFLAAAFTKGDPVWEAMEGLTKGLEIRLPGGASYLDVANVERRDIRVKWWHHSPQSYRDVAIVREDEKARIPEAPLPGSFPAHPVDGPPVLVGHYWMSGTPAIESPRLACLDWSAALDGPLVAYRWSGEPELDPANLIAA